MRRTVQRSAARVECISIAADIPRLMGRRAFDGISPGLGRLVVAATLAWALPTWIGAQEIDDAGGMSAKARAFRCPTPESPRFRSLEGNGVKPNFPRTSLPI